MSQQALDFGRLYRVEEQERVIYRSLNDAVESIGGIVVAAGACGIDRADLRRSLDHKTRYLAVEHAMSITAILRGSNSDLASRICRAFVSVADFAIADAAPPLTDRERADRLESAMRSMPLGEQLVAHALGGRR